MMIYYSWQNGPAPAAPYTRTSPNIAALRSYGLARFGGVNLGTYGVRPITGGTSWSTHAFGAAWDWGFSAGGVVDRAASLRFIDFLTEHHEVLGIQMIVDEGYDRAWKCSRPELNGKPGWKTSNINGGWWLHIETHPDHWANATPIVERLHTPPAPTPDVAPPIVGAPNTTENIDMIVLDYMPNTASWTAFVWNGVELAWIRDGNASGVLTRANVKRLTVNRDELAGIIADSRCTTAAPYTLDAELTAAWN